ncbi:MAG: O-antigen ligase family protein [Acidimicrobiales bacterium]|nr:O-antigen ligase family protein [Acidimicrobiales bacterium]
MPRPSTSPARATGAGTRAPTRPTPAGSPRPPLVDALAPLTLAGWLLLYFDAFDLLVSFPGSVKWLLFPGWCLGVLLLTPVERLRSITVQWSLVALVGVLATSLWWSIEPSMTFIRLRTDLPGLVLVLAVVATIPATKAVRTVATTSTAMAVWSLGISLALPVARVAEVGSGTDVGSQFGFRGSFIHKNLLGMFLIFGLCAVLVQPRGRDRTAAMAVHLVTILGTRSASVGGGLLIVGFVWLWISAIERQNSPRKRAFFLTASAVSAATGLMLVLGFLPTLLDLYDKDVTFSGRTIIWTESIRTIQDRPLLGYGLGAVWHDEASPVTADLQARIGFPAAHAHNGALDLVLQVGLVGLTMYTIAVLQTLRASARLTRRSETVAVGQWGILTVASLLLMSVAENIFLGPFLGLVAVIWVVTTRAHRAADPVASMRPSVRRRVPVTDG